MVLLAPASETTSAPTKEAHTCDEPAAPVSALLLILLSLTACSDDSGSTGSTGSGGKGTTIDITIKGGKVTPHGDRVKAKVGQPVTLNIDADTSGEIHVHSSPEQEIAFDKGTSTKKPRSTCPASWTSRTTPSSR